MPGRVSTLLLAAWLAWAPSSGRADGPAADAVDAAFGPLFHGFETTIVPGHGWEALGPLLGRSIETDEAGGADSWRFSPLVSGVREPGLDRTEWELLYPALTYDRFGTEWRFQFLQLFSLAGGQTSDDEVRRRTTLFPIYFRQTSTGGTNDYLAVLPLYGRLQNRLFRDRVEFVLAPAWVRSEKRGVVTDNYLMPFFHRRKGAGVDGWQFWPVLGHETREVRWRTNLVDELEVVPGHDKWFAGWPFYFSERLRLGTTNVVTNRFIFPVHLRTRSPAMDHTWWFFFSQRTNRAAGYSEWSAPWPFVGGADGPGRQGRRLWPIHGWARSANLQSDFLLWPLWTERRQIDTDLDRRRARGLFFIYNDIEMRDRTHGRTFHRRDLWPFFTWRRDPEGRERLRVLALLEPIVPNTKSVERLYSPVWSLYHSEENPVTGRTSRSVLWNLWRRDTAPGRTRTAMFFGLIRTERTGEGRRWGVFRWPGRPEAVPAAGEEIP